MVLIVFDFTNVHQTSSFNNLASNAYFGLEFNDFHVFAAIESPNHFRLAFINIQMDVPAIEYFLEITL